MVFRRDQNGTIARAAPLRMCFAAPHWSNRVNLNETDPFLALFSDLVISLFGITMTKSLMEHFKSQNLVTDVGEFTIVDQIGQGGNALVFSFKKMEKLYAIKFLPMRDKRKFSRLVDEFFLVMQTPPHPNIARAYHFDTVQVADEPHSLIVMKLYDRSLAKCGSVVDRSEEDRTTMGAKLMSDLASGLRHLHAHQIIHRDIKPENIFYDAAEDRYLIGDMGIAHFADANLPRESKTTKGERLANLRFSPSDQIDAKGTPLPAWDIYALAQVLSWFLFGEVIRGGGRQCYRGKNRQLKAIDGFIEKATRNSPIDRFHSFDEVYAFMKAASESRRDIFARFQDLDETLRRSFPEIGRIHQTTDPLKIRRFIDNFEQLCRAKEFYYIREDGGDLDVSSLRMLPDDRGLLCNHYELKVSRLILYKHPGAWRSFFILMVSADAPFEIVDFDGNRVARPDMTKWEEDEAVLYDGVYVDPSSVRAGYYEKAGMVYPVEADKERHRCRKLKDAAFLIVPTGSGPNAADRSDNIAFLASVIANQGIDKKALDRFLQRTLPFADPEVTSRA